MPGNLVEKREDRKLRSWEDGKKQKEKKAIENILMKSFWESRTLFSKRVLAAGGIDFRFKIN